VDDELSEIENEDEYVDGMGKDIDIEQARFASPSPIQSAR